MKSVRVHREKKDSILAIDLLPRLCVVFVYVSLVLNHVGRVGTVEEG